MLVGKKYKQLYHFVEEHKDVLLEYLIKTIPRNSLVHWSENSFMDIKFDDKYKQFEIITFSADDYDKYLRKDYPFSYQGHFSINSDGYLRCSQTGRYPGLTNQINKNVSEYVLEFWQVEQREYKLNKLL